MVDKVSSESSFSWRLAIVPTKFDGFFCESVTREYESNPEPCGRQNHIWRCSFTENMINGVATVDIAIQSVEVSLPLSSSSSCAKKASPSRDRQQQQQQHQPEYQQDHQFSTIKNDKDPMRLNHYNTIALHTPKLLTPLMFTSIDKGATDENLIQIGLEADMIRHKGLYEIEIVFSEEKSSNMNPSPSSCHRLFDSLYHNIAATSLPDMSTADIWFELYSPPPMTIRAKSMKLSSSSSSLHTNSPPSDPCHCQNSNGLRFGEQGYDHDTETITIVGAHSDVLLRYPYFADWIKRERRLQNVQRCQQLQAEWRIHLEQRNCQYQHHQQQRPYQSTELPVNDFKDPQQTICSREKILSYHPHPHEIRSCSQSISTNLLASCLPIHALRHSTKQQQTNASLDPGVDISHIHQTNLHLDHSPFPPTLCIPVKDISLGTFQVILQYIYTGSIGLSKYHLNEISTYWNTISKNLSQQSTSLNNESLIEPGNVRQSLDDQNEEKENRAYSPIILPIPWANPVSPKDQEKLRQSHESEDGKDIDTGSKDPTRFHRKIRDTLMSNEVTMHTKVPSFTPWIPFSPINRQLEPYQSQHPSNEPPSTLKYIHENVMDKKDISSYNCQYQQERDQDSCHSKSIPKSTVKGSEKSSSPFIIQDNLYKHPSVLQACRLPSGCTYPTCSWESLLLGAHHFNLKDLEALSMKAIKYHCQMMSLRALINDTMIDEVAYKGFDRLNFDLQLAIGENTLLALIELYKSPELVTYRRSTQASCKNDEYCRDIDDDRIDSFNENQAKDSDSLSNYLRYTQKNLRCQPGRQFQHPIDDDAQRQEQGIDWIKENDPVIRYGSEQADNNNSVVKNNVGTSQPKFKPDIFQADRTSRRHLFEKGSDGSNDGSQGQQNIESRFTEDKGSEQEGRDIRKSSYGVTHMKHPSLTWPIDHPECEEALETLCEDLREQFLRMSEIMFRHK